MKDNYLTKHALIEEISALKQRIRELECSEAQLKQLGEALVQSEERYRTLVENATDIVFKTDHTGRFTFVNPAALHITGYQENEIIGTHYRQYIRPDMREDVITFLMRQLESRIQNTYYEFVLITKEGHEIWLGQNTQLILQDGRVSGFQAIARDITERKRAEEARRQESSFRNAIIDNVAEGLCVCHEITEYPFVKFTVWNDRMTEITGYTLEEINRLGWYQTVYPDPDLQARAIERMKRMRKGDDIRVEEWEITRNDGNKFILNISTSIVKSVDGVVHVLALMQDITDRKRVQEALHRSETHYRLLAENATDVIWTVGMDMRLTYVSPSVTRLLGFTVEEAMARTAQQAYTPAAFEKAMRVFAEEIANENKGHYNPARSRMLELELIRKDGNTIPVEGHFCFMRDSTGQATGILAIMRDITDHKRMEEALRKSEEKYRELSIMDDLTQLYNSRHFYHELKIEIARSDRYRQPLTLLLLDLDDFKRYNDLYGHIEGDHVLCRLGQVVRRCLRQTDSAYRYGGEEFTILLPMITSAEGAATAERIRTEFKKEIFCPVPDQDVHVTVSIGLAQYEPQEEMKAFVHRVDQLMYQGKKEGKDRVCCGS